MTIALTRVFFDTNVYIIGAADPNSYEGQLLQWGRLKSRVYKQSLPTQAKNILIFYKHSCGRLKSRLYKQSLPTQANNVLIFESAKADFVCVAAPLRVTAILSRGWIEECDRIFAQSSNAIAQRASGISLVFNPQYLRWCDRFYPY